jgi:ActR/RegA family two-component response regulator
VENVLIVDDEPAVLFSMQEYLTLRGYHAVCAKDVGEAIFLLDHHTFEFVIADLRLNGREDGLDVIRIARDRSPAVKLLLLTAYSSPELQARACNLGVHACLCKPQPLNRIADILQTLAG